MVTCQRAQEHAEHQHPQVQAQLVVQQARGENEGVAGEEGKQHT